MRFSFTTMALVLMAVLTHQTSGNADRSANFSAPAAAAIVASVPDRSTGGDA